MGRHLFKLGDRCDDYEIIELLGAGGFAEVYKAKNTETGELVALKCLQLRHGENRHIVQRMKAEAELLNTVDHNNLVEVLDFGKSSDVLYMAMELLVGKVLRDLLDEHKGRLPLQRVLYIGREIADGLAAAHERGVVHRDLKPENIFITDDNRVKVLDLGAGKFFGWGLTSTVPGYVIGTPLYMAPEHVLGHPVDGRTDVFSLGLMLYEMLAEHPLQRMRNEGASKMEIATLQVHFKPAPPRVLNPDVPEDVSALVMKAIEKDPSNRFRSMREMAQAIRRARKSHSVELRRVAATEGPPAADARVAETPKQAAAQVERASDEVTTTKRSPGLTEGAKSEASTTRQAVVPIVERLSGGTERMSPIDASIAAMSATAVVRRFENADTEPLRSSDASVPPMHVSVSPAGDARSSVDVGDASEASSSPDDDQASSSMSSSAASEANRTTSKSTGAHRAGWLSRRRARAFAAGPLASSRVRRVLRKKVARPSAGVMLLLFGAAMAALSLVAQWVGPPSRSSVSEAPSKVGPAAAAPVTVSASAATAASSDSATSVAAPAPAATSAARQAPLEGGSPAMPSASSVVGAAMDSATSPPTTEISVKPKVSSAPQPAGSSATVRRKPPPKTQPVFVLE